MLLTARPTATGRPARALEGLAWVGLLAGLLASSVACAAAPGPGQGPLLVAMGPSEFTAWVSAICGAIGAVTAALNGVAIAWHRWGRPPRRPRARPPRARKPEVESEG